MQLDDAMDDGEPEPHAARARRIAAYMVHLPERIEEMRQRVRRNAHAVVAHDQLYMVFSAMTLDQHIAARRRTGERVGEQVVHDLAQTVRIALDRSGAGIDERFEPHAT